MSRLTNNNKDNPILKDVGHANCKNICEHEMYCDMCPIQDAIDKLAHYEDLEEQGRLIITEVGVGQTVWAIGLSSRMESGIFKVVNDVIKVRVEDIFDALRYSRSLGDTVFLTREEAEKALAELKGTEDGSI